MEPNPSWQEYYVILYILSTGCEKIREITSSEPHSVRHKLTVWSFNVWNQCDGAAIIFFLIGLGLRLTPSWMQVGRVIICVDIVYWYIRILNLLGVNKYLGPLLTIMSMMIKSMAYFVLLLLVMVMSFGICRQSIMYPDNDFGWGYLKNAIFHPYFMMFGEVFDNEINPDCGDGEGLIKCVTGRWISPLAQALYLVMANFLLVNLMIAVFNNIFNEVNAISHQFWMFQRFTVVMEYKQKPILPPPLITLCHIFFLLNYCVRKVRGVRESFDSSFKLFLDGEDLERLYDFGEECVEGFCREKETKLNMSSDETIRNTAQRVDNVYQKVEDINQKENIHMSNIQTVEFRIRKLEDLSLEHLAVVHSFIATYTKDRQFISESLSDLSRKNLMTKMNRQEKDDKQPEYPQTSRLKPLGRDYLLRRRPSRSLTEVTRGSFILDESLSSCKLDDPGDRDSKTATNETPYSYLEEELEVEKDGDEESTEAEPVTSITVQIPINETGDKTSGSDEHSVANSIIMDVDEAEETIGLDASLLDFLQRNSVEFWSQRRDSAKTRNLSVGVGGRDTLPHSPRRQRSETYSGPEIMTENEETDDGREILNTEQAERNLAWAESRLKLKQPIRNPHLTLLTPQSEYTSITDELESMCGLLREPVTLIPPRRDRHHSEMSNPEMALYLEKEHLRDAEDNDYQLMERLIQRHYEDESTDNAFYLGHSPRRESAVEMPSPTGAQAQAQQGPAIFCTDTDTQQLKLLRTSQPDGDNISDTRR